MKKVACFVLLVLSFAVSGCNSNSAYNKGYEDAWNEEGKPNWFSSKKYREGYQQGLDAAEMYQKGFGDASTRTRARYPNDSDYMEGYEAGKR